MENRIGAILRAGVIVSALLVICGGILYLSRYGTVGPAFAHFKGEPERLKDIYGIIRSALSLHPRGIIQLGLLCLIATPIMRVIFSLGMYAKHKDSLYVVITSIVLCLLLYSLIFVR
ncbi:MAG: DUF1634 domain-containing protein [Candidatus Omnitrophica bacterium]|nr:DUF1634 domain-containing protein [Candidatus Omnitrophota bacterium]